MDANSWIDRLSSSRRYQYALQSRSSDMFMGFEDIEADNDTREEFQCPFCSDYFDLGGLCCHIGDEHPLGTVSKSKIRLMQYDLVACLTRQCCLIHISMVCPVCGVRFVGLDIVTHITLHHGNLFKMHGKRKLRKTGSISLLSLLRRELREANLQSKFGRSYVVSSANAAPDPLLSSFILPMGDDLGINISPSLTDPMVLKKSTSKNVREREIESTPLSFKDKEERSRRCDFVQGMLLSTMFGDNF
ncbi:protein DEHYDRATION-INDUCED 19 homolog 6-like [Bidens hawaiensis]|uniref:protein DEHYDRATION-INDUCED 19 homolog 6-like n=1 Tax=Bidens hawaiensis TaxID=980011 RepID=UPI00404A38D4